MQCRPLTSVPTFFLDLGIRLDSIDCTQHREVMLMVVTDALHSGIGIQAQTFEDWGKIGGDRAFLSFRMARPVQSTRRR